MDPTPGVALRPTRQATLPAYGLDLVPQGCLPDPTSGVPPRPMSQDHTSSSYPTGTL